MVPRNHLVILGVDNPVGLSLSEQAQTHNLRFHALTSTEWNLNDLAEINRHLQEIRPTLVINTLTVKQGLTPERAAYLAQACESSRVALLQLSSSLVFSGQEGSHFTEQDALALNTDEAKRYAAIEDAVVCHCQRHLLLRVGWLFSSKGEDVASRVLMLSRQESQLSLSDRKQVSPTSACDTAAVLLAMARQVIYTESLWGTYHYSSSEVMSLFQFAEVVVANARQYDPLMVESIIADNASDMNRHFSEASPLLSSKKILYSFGIKPKPWKQALSRVLKRRYQVSA
jgi:dTDP-4-dehydrorhamnose reductase